MNYELVEMIKRRISEVAEGLNNDTAWEQTIAREYDLLPLYSDLGGSLALRADLEIIAIPDDPKQTLHIEINPLWRNIALFQGSKKYPELKILIPTKPGDAIDCPDCDGTGIALISFFKKYENFICKCGGVGWLPAQANYNHFSYNP